MISLLKIRLILPGILFLHLAAFGQMESKNWYFGDGRDGLIFNGSNYPAQVRNKAKNVGFEGIIVVSNPATGELLFYSDGISIINRNHSRLQGVMLTGEPSGAQCVQSCPVPGTCSKQYYLFTNSCFDRRGGTISYSVFDFSNEIRGSAVKLNEPLPMNGYSSEGMCLVNKPNSNDYWFIYS